MIALLTDTNNNISQLNSISEFSFLSELKSPTINLKITFNLNFKPTTFYKIKLIHQKLTIFDGFIDNQSISISHSGLSLTISARSKSCLLIDNQATPQTFLNISLKEILDKYIYPYGFSYKNIDPYLLSKSLKSFTVFPKMSSWSVLESFILKLSNKLPFFINNNEVMCSFINTPISISNNINQNIHAKTKNFNYSHLSACLQNIGPPPDILTKNIDYPAIDNLIYKNATNQTKKSSSKNKLNNISYLQNQQYLTLNVTVPNLFPLGIGHQVTVIDDIINNNQSNNQFIINKIHYIFKNNILNSFISLFSLPSP